MNNPKEHNFNALLTLAALSDEMEIRKQFPTYSDAIKEISRLRNEIRNPPKKQRGRPRRQSKDSWPFALFAPTNSQDKKPCNTRKRVGAPTKNTRDEMIKIIQAIDATKLEYHIKNDEECISKWVTHVYKDAGIAQFRVTEKIKPLLSQLKYFRDTTKMPQKRR